MDNLAQEKQYHQTALEYATVMSAKRNTCLVLSTSGGCFEATIAVSCLVQPEKGDCVLLSVNTENQTYILSILERPDQLHQETNLRFEGQVNLNVKNGGLQLTAAKEMSFAAQENMTLASPLFNIAARKGNIKIEKVSFFGKFLSSRIEKIRIIADTVDAVLRRSVQRLTSSYRYIEEHEEVQSASTRMLVEGTLTMQTKNTMHTAEGHIKIDAEQIHLG